MKKIKAMAITVSIAMVLSTFVLGCGEPEAPTLPENTIDDSSNKDDNKQDDSGKQDDSKKDDSDKQDDSKKDDSDKQDDSKKDDSGKQDDSKKDDSGKQDDSEKDDSGKQDDSEKDDSGKQDDSKEDDDKKQDDGSAILQALIEAAKNGGTVKLDKTVKDASITINQKLTIDGDGIENLSITVNPDVANDVTLSNLVNATVTIKNTDAGRCARAARAASAGEDPKKEEQKPREIGDDNPKMYFENCSFEKISAEDDISIFMKEDSLKSTVKEIELKESVDSFVLIEDEREDLSKDRKSSIDKITIEKGVDEVELLGGYYKDIEFKGEFTAEDKVDLYYDEKGEQVEASFKEYLTKQTEKVAARDICNVKNGKGIYKFTIPTEEIDNMNNGAIAIILLKDNQKDAFLKSDFSMGMNFSWATVKEPYFEITSTGYFKYETKDNDVHSICGSDTSNYFGATDSADFYEFFNNYSPDGICSQKTAAGIEIYLDLSRVLKSDLATCAFETDGSDDAYYCKPSKLTEIDLEGYKPYISINIANYDPMCEGKIENLKTKITIENEHEVIFPFSKSNGSHGFKQGYFTKMPEANAYPDITRVMLNVWECPFVSLYDGASLVRKVQRDQFTWDQDEFDFYLDKECTKLLWYQLYTDEVDTLYVKAQEKIHCHLWDFDEDMSRAKFWEQTCIGENYDPPKRIYTKLNPTYEEIANGDVQVITDINQLIPGEKYYWCDAPKEPDSE